MIDPNRLAEIGREIGELCRKKNPSYGSAYEDIPKVLRIMYPNGVSHDQMDDLPMICRTLEKLFRVVNDKDAFGESPYLDIAGIGIIGAAIDEMRATEVAESETP